VILFCGDIQSVSEGLVSLRNERARSMPNGFVTFCRASRWLIRGEMTLRASIRLRRGAPHRISRCGVRYFGTGDGPVCLHLRHLSHPLSRCGINSAGCGVRAEGYRGRREGGLQGILVRKVRSWSGLTATQAFAALPVSNVMPIFSLSPSVRCDRQVNRQSLSQATVSLRRVRASSLYQISRAV
jgi:hypothetical protein